MVSQSHVKALIELSSYHVIPKSPKLSLLRSDSPERKWFFERSIDSELYQANFIVKIGTSRTRLRFHLILIRNA